MTRGQVRIFAAALCALIMSVARPQPPAPAPAVLDGPARAAVVEAAAGALGNGYVFPDVGRQAAEAIRKALAAGSYDTLSTPSALAERLTADLQAVAHDKHLRLFAPGPAPAAAPPFRSEGGITRADRLAGGIGYLEIVAFPPLGVFQPALDRAMAALAGTRALIIDARRHGGGGADAEAYLASYFLKKGTAPVAVNRFIWRNPGTETFRTDDFLSSSTPFSYAGKPVYVLTSSSTFSGGEALAYDLRALGLCKTVGETTGGGGHPGGMMPVGSGLAMFLPGGRGENPTTKGNWEGVGVQPDFPVGAADALKLALQRLGRKPTAGEIDGLSQARLFAPHTAQQTGSEAAVRRIIDEMRRGEPDYALLSSDLAKATRAQLPRMHELFTKLGPITSVTFVEVDAQGFDAYDVQLASGSLRMAVTVTPDGKTAGAGFRLTGPPPQ
jgi:hypothetical protein